MQILKFFWTFQMQRLWTNSSNQCSVHFKVSGLE